MNDIEYYDEYFTLEDKIYLEEKEDEIREQALLLRELIETDIELLKV